METLVRVRGPTNVQFVRVQRGWGDRQIELLCCWFLQKNFLEFLRCWEYIPLQLDNLIRVQVGERTEEFQQIIGFQSFRYR